MSSIDSQPETNPYAAPVAPIGGAIVELEDTMGGAEAIRREYLKHEVASRSLASLHLMGLFGGAGVLVPMVLNGGFRGEDRYLLFASVGAIGFLMALNLTIGIGIFKLREWARWTDIVLCGLALLSLLAVAVVGVTTGTPRWPFLTVAGIVMVVIAFILDQLLSSSSAMVFSARYRAIVARTPQVKHQPSLRKYRPSLIVKLAVGLLVLVLLLIAIVGIVAQFDD